MSKVDEGTLEPAPFEEFIWMLEDAHDVFPWIFRDIRLMLLDLVEEQVLKLVAFAAPSRKALKVKTSGSVVVVWETEGHQLCHLLTFRS